MPAAHPFERKLDTSWPASQWQDVTVLLAVSGGADSVALLRAIAVLKQGGEGRLVVAHFNHGLRGADSDADQAFVEDLSRRMNLPFECGTADPSALTQCGSDGREATARKARYRFLRETAKRCGARYLVTAHTADDQAETILHRIIRGTGVAGLAGIPRIRRVDDSISLVRPFLDIRRAEVTDYLSLLGQPYRTDASNDDASFTRNRIRRELLPLLRLDYNEQITDALLRLGSLAQQSRSIIDESADRLLTQSVSETINGTSALDCVTLAAADPFLVREALIKLWQTRGWPMQDMSYEKWDELAALATADASAPRVIQLPGNVIAAKRDQCLTISRGDG